MENELKSGQVASYLNAKFNVRIQSVDVHRIAQIAKTKIQSLNDVNLSMIESQRLLTKIIR